MILSHEPGGLKVKTLIPPSPPPPRILPSPSPQTPHHNKHNLLKPHKGTYNPRP